MPNDPSSYNVSIQAQRPALLSGRTQVVTALVRVQAPTAPDTQRPRLPLNLALVIDRSGSMEGRPIEEAKRCVKEIIRSLAPDDIISVTSFDDEVQVNIPATPIGSSRSELIAAVSVISTGGSTALFAGWHAGATEAARNVDTAPLSRVLLLSDGGANHGESRPHVIAKHCAELASAGVTTSTYGLGSRFNEKLMVEMAAAGLGSSYYGKTAADLADPFREEFDLLRALYGRKVTLQMVVPPGVKAKVRNGYAYDKATQSYRLPDLAYGGEAWALVDLEVPARLVPALEGGALRCLEVRVSCDDLQGVALPVETAKLELEALPGVAYFALLPDPLTTSRMDEVRVAELQDRVREAAEGGDWGTVDAVIALAMTEAENNPWLMASISRLQLLANSRDRHRTSKEAFYSSRKMRSRLSASQEDIRGYSAAAEASSPSYLRRKSEQGRSFGDEE